MLTVEILKNKFLGGKSLDLDKIIDMAYNDMQPRTITGHTEDIKEDCVKYLKEEFEEIVKNGVDGDYNTAHENLCDGFLSVMNSHCPKIKMQEYGKAQKVINIIFKFLAAYGKIKNESDCHMPIDSFVLKWRYGTDTYEGKTAWSNLNKEQYDKIQEDIIERIKDDITVGNTTVKVNNRVEADYYIWYITKVERSYNDAKNAIKGLAKAISESDSECVSKEIVEELINEAEELKNKLLGLKF